MRSDKSPLLSNMTTRQKVTAGLLVLVVIFILWQIFSLFGSRSETPTITPSAQSAKVPGAPGAMAPQTPTAATLTKQPAQPTTQREMELMKLQQETEAKYMAALNELQMLKISREIAETNQAIASAKLATITAEKGIINLLAPALPQVPADAYAKGLVNPVTSGNQVTQTTTQTTQQPEVNYTVISVSQLQYRWSAVLGYQGNLYNVFVGDVLPADGSTVISISRTGVMLEKNGVKKKVSLVPII